MTGAVGPSDDGVGTFRNPVHGRVLADPFVLKWNGAYYAYGTPEHGAALPVLRSTDLVSWEPAGEALGPPPPGLAHWAPEVAYDNGRFFLYCSTGGHEGEGHRLRVAAGRAPTGPFDEDLGVLDPDDPFTIDAHPFLDEDGQWYLFYARDFLDGERVGTGVVVDRLVGMSRLAGERRTVLRPHAEWHLFERERRWYDRVWDWYTVEGPFVRKHEGRYWCFYSGGAWKAETYGMSAVVSDHPLGPYRPAGDADGVRAAADVLRTVPGRAVGPGHGCVAEGPDNLAEYLVYHAWDAAHTGRYVHVDRLVWTGGRPGSPGPSTGPQPRPPEPLVRDLFLGAPGVLDGRRWRVDGRWDAGTGELRPAGAGPAMAVLGVEAPARWLLEVNVAFPGPPAPGRCAGALTSWAGAGDHTAVLLRPDDGSLVWRSVRAGDEATAVLARLPAGFRPEAWHRLLVRHEGDVLEVLLDGVRAVPATARLGPGASVGLVAAGGSAAFAGVALTDLSAAAHAAAP